MIILEPETFDIQNNSKVILTIKKGNYIQETLIKVKPTIDFVSQGCHRIWIGSEQGKGEECHFCKTRKAI